MLCLNTQYNSLLCEFLWLFFACMTRSCSTDSTADLVTLSYVYHTALVRWLHQLSRSDSCATVYSERANSSFALFLSSFLPTQPLLNNGTGKLEHPCIQIQLSVPQNSLSSTTNIPTQGHDGCSKLLRRT